MLYAPTAIFYPTLALPVLLLSGISTGLGAPFVANFVGIELPLIVAVPFVLPPIVHILFGSHFSIPVIQMIVLLVVALFIPLLAGWITKKFAPKIAEIVSEKSLYLSIILIVIINIALFSKFSTFFFESPLFVIEMVLLAFILFGIYGIAGYTLTLFITGITGHTTSERKNATIDSKSSTKKEWDRSTSIDGLITMAYVNNILVALFAEQCSCKHMFSFWRVILSFLIYR